VHWVRGELEAHSGNTSPNEMNVDLDVFRLSMIHRVAGHVNDVVTKNHHCELDNVVRLEVVEAIPQHLPPHGIRPPH
jgi:hypothetical protein